MKRTTRTLLAGAIAGAIVALGASLPATEATEAAQTVIIGPGLLIAGLFWPEGAHSGMGSSVAGVWLMFTVFYLVAFAFWSAVLYAVLTALFNMRR